MANVVENDKVVIGECEATVVVSPTDFFKNSNLFQGDWAQVKNRPDHIKGTADWAVYPTRHYKPGINNLEKMVAIADEHRVSLGRNEAQKKYLTQFLRGELEIVDIGDFDASTKPVPISSLPYWWFVRSEKDEQLGKSITVKTPRLETYEDVQRLQIASGALTTQMLDSKESIGVIDRIIIKYQLKVGENSEGDICVPADFRADRIYQLKRQNGILTLSEPTYVTSVECELAAEGSEPSALQRGIDTIYRTLDGLGGMRTRTRFGKLSLANDTRYYLERDLQSSNRHNFNESKFSTFYSAMQRDGTQIFEAYAKSPDSINRQVEPANRELMAQLQRADRF